jgi:hypothetical protein
MVEGMFTFDFFGCLGMVSKSVLNYKINLNSKVLLDRLLAHHLASAHSKPNQNEMTGHAFKKMYRIINS